MTETETSRMGDVKVDGDRATLTFRRYLHHPRETVWKAITETHETSKWYLSAARIEGREGGSVEFSAGQGRVTGRILVWDPPHILEHEWNVDRPGYPKGVYGVIRWELLPDGENTILRLVHRDLPGQVGPNFAPGVHAILDRFEAYLDNSPLPDWRKRQDEVRHLYLQQGN